MTQARRVVVVDDDPTARMRLIDLVAAERDFQLVGTCQDGVEAIERLRLGDVDLVFLDVDMPRKTGLEVIAEMGDEMPPVVFVTGFMEYAVRAFEACAIDFLLKPYDDARFHAALEKLREHLKEVKALHEQDLAKGYSEIFLPDALSRKYPKAAKEWAWQYVFPSSKLSVDPRSGKIGRHHISDTAIQDAIKNALRKAEIPKHASVHTLRHSFATHLLQSGVNIREVQSLLGHKHVETTMIYTHVLRDMKNAPQSPLDALYKNRQ